jgi:hypothetical protein
LLSEGRIKEALKRDMIREHQLLEEAERESAEFPRVIESENEDEEMEEVKKIEDEVEDVNGSDDGFEIINNPQAVRRSSMQNKENRLRVDMDNDNEKPRRLSV